MDLLTFLKDEYQKWLESDDDSEEFDCYIDIDEHQKIWDDLGSFIAWANHYLEKTNTVINTAYMPRGMGFRMQQGQILAMFPQEKKEVKKPMRDEGIMINKPKGYQNMLPDDSIPITGTEEYS